MSAGVRRRTVLAGVLAAGVAGVAGCGAEAGAGVSVSSSPRRGGRLRLVALGSPTGGLNPLTATDGASFIAMFQIYDQLVRLQGDRVVASLAESVEPNANATMWTIRIRDGVRFHDGRAVTADDVAYSLRQFGDPKRSPTFGQLYADVDLANLKVRDPRTVEVPLRRARGDLVDSVLAQMSLVFPAGTTDRDWVKGVGSGPFRLVSAAGGGVTLARNDEYWGGAPLLDEVTVAVVVDPAARLNAVRGGQADYAVDVTPAGARSVANAADVQIRRGGPANSMGRSFEMNVQTDPFRDADVRRALRLLVDRQQLVDNVLLGQGQVGNDVYGLGLPGYHTALPQRTRDVDQARSLLAKAGVTRLTIKAADLQAGTVDAARLLAEQAREVGLTITVEQAPADTYFNDYAGVLSTPLQAFYFINRPAATMISTFTGSDSSFNVTGVRGGDFDRRLATARATVDDAARRERFNELQRYLWDSGGDIVWGYAEQLDAVRPGVGGVQLNQSAPLLGTAYLPA